MTTKDLVKRVAAIVDRVKPPPPGITILIYHRVGGGTGGEVDLDPATFDRQLAHLASHHRVLSLDAAVAELEGGRPTEPGVVLTFDDGTADFTDVVVPLLLRHHVPATVYVATAFVEEQRPFPWGAAPTTWSALGDAATTGLVTVGSHTHDHRVLQRLDRATAAGDIDLSIDLITERIGQVPRHFAYPKAVPPSAPAEVVVRQRFASAALAGGRSNVARDCDLLRLGRTPVLRSDSFEQFVARAGGGLQWEGTARAVAARVRYRGAVT